MDDVARAAGVSRALVSIVFADKPGASTETRARVRQVAADLGYQIDRRARLLGGKRTKLIGVTFVVGSLYHADLLVPLYAAARERGYELALSGVVADQSSERRSLDDLVAMRCDAVILLAPLMRRSDIAAAAIDAPPMVVVGGVLQAAGVDTVSTDDTKGAELATGYLLELGHRRIMHVDGGREPAGVARRRGFRKVMRAHRLEPLVLPGGPDPDDGTRVAREILRYPAEIRPTATWVFNDQSASGFLATARYLGCRVPEDMSLIGYDDSGPARAEWASLTSIRQDIDAIADAAVELVVARVGGDDSDDQTVLIEPQLVVRDTTAPPSH